MARIAEQKAPNGGKQLARISLHRVELEPLELAVCRALQRCIRDGQTIDRDVVRNCLVAQGAHAARAAAMAPLLLARATEIVQAEGGVLASASAVTDAQIEALRDEAASAGDLAQVRICQRALDGDDDARAECARVIAEAAAQRSERQVDAVAAVAPELLGLAKQGPGGLYKPDASPTKLRCARCGRPAMWIAGAGEALCVRHQDDY